MAMSLLNGRTIFSATTVQLRDPLHRAAVRPLQAPGRLPGEVEQLYSSGGGRASVTRLNEQAQGATDRYAALDGLRGAAAIAVAAYHAAALAGRQYVPGGYLAVDLFFALSGFVIAHAYDSRLADGLAPARFMLMRLARFWPLYLLGLALGVLHQIGLLATGNTFALDPPSLLMIVAAGVVFLPTALAPGANLFPLNIPGWSLFVELLANAGFALFHRHLGNRVLFVCVLAGLAMLVPLCLWKGDADLGARLPTLAGGLARVLFSFPLGVLIYRQGWRVRRVPLWAMVLLVLAVLCLPVPAPARGLYDLLFIAIVSPLLVAAGSGVSPAGPAALWCERAGAVSYALYAIHRPLFALAAPLAKRVALHPALATVAAVTGALILATIADRRFDRPARRWLAMRFGIGREPVPREATLP